MKSQFTPRSISDFQKMESLLMKGHSNDQILKKLQKEWRSEVIQLPGGSVHCAECFQIINTHSCFECGQSITEDY